MSQPSENYAKMTLQRINRYFQQRKRQPVFAPVELRLKIQRSNGIAKNFLRLCNKTMMGLNRIHISRGKVIAGLTGLLLGYICSEGEQAIMTVRQNFYPTIKSALILHVLQNQQIKDTLNRNLLENVYTNPEIQFSLHEVLDWKAIRPQMDHLFLLSKEGIIQALKDQVLMGKLSNVVSEAMNTNRNLISSSVLDFLQGEKLTSIVRREITDFFRSETFYRLLAKEVIGNVNKELSNIDNRDKLYRFCKENFLNW